MSTPVGRPTLCELFQRTVARHGDRPALSAAGRPTITWREYGERVAQFADGLLALGITRGATVALMTGNTPEFHVADMAVMHAGAVPYSVHGDDPVADLVERLEVAGTRLILTELAHLVRAREIAAVVDASVRIVVLDGPGADGELALDDVRALAPTGVAAPMPIWRTIGPEDTATLIFTSGTTGRPKAVQLPHRAVSVSLQTFLRVAPGGEDGRVLSYLPLTHIAERFMSYYLGIGYGAEIHCVTDPADLYDTLVQIRPTRFFGVPRVYAKLAARARELIGTDPAMTEALAIGRAEVQAAQSDAAVVSDVARAAREVLVPIGVALGLDQASYRGVATAPSSYELLEFFAALGLPVGDIWGMSEAIMCTANPTARIKLGTVGRFLDEVQARVADDGELQVRGPNTFTGYRNDPVRTAELQAGDGWVRTGDVGRIDDEGYLTIVGRKKELMITATGKNIVPAAIEDAVKDASALIDQAIAIADGRRFVTALLALDGERLATLAHQHGSGGTFAELVRLPAVEAEVARAVAVANARLPRAETVRSWRIADVEWRPGGDEVTATMKLRRSEIQRKYADVIEAMYAPVS